MALVTLGAVTGLDAVALVLEGTVTGPHGAVLLANGEDVVSVAGDGSFFVPKKVGPHAT